MRRALLLLAFVVAPVGGVGGCATGVRPSGGHPDGGGVDAAPAADAMVDAKADEGTDATALPDYGPPDAGCMHDSDCDDHLGCDGTETCVAGGCVSGTTMTCDDSLACTRDLCVEPGTCQHTPDATLCTGRDLCDPAMGCIAPPACTGAAMCDDHLACDGVEICDPTIGCQPGMRPSCDDGVACTADSCVEPAGTCNHVAQDADRDGYPLAGCLGGTDCNDLSATVHPGAVDVCDGIDNDCDGTPDNAGGLTCALGSAPAGCTTTCGSAGTQACNSVCMRGPCFGTEVCNGCDDDGDGTIDNGLTCRMGASSSCTTACGTTGQQTCNASCSGFSTCLSPVEVCGNSCDDNGNGAVDEGCSAPPPPNDTCGGVTPLSGASGTTAGTLVGATAQTSDCSISGGVEVFYSLTTASPSIVYLDTLGASIDTKISYRGGSCPGSTGGSGTGPNCADDACGTTATQLVVQVPAGTSYFAVHTYSSSTVPSPFSLRWQVMTSGSSGAAALSGVGTFSGTTITGTSNISGTCGGSAGGPEYAYYWAQCPTDTHNVTGDMCGSSFDTVLHILGPTGELACNDDDPLGSCGLQSRLGPIATSGVGLYALVADGYLFTSSGGAYTLHVTSF